MGGVCSNRRKIPSNTPLCDMYELWSEIRRKSLEWDKMINLCIKEWPKFGTDWPKNDSFELRDIAAINAVINYKGLWKQKPYLELWKDVSQNSEFRMAKQLLCKAKQR